MNFRNLLKKFTLNNVKLYWDENKEDELLN